MSRHVFLHVGDTHLCSAHPRNADRLAALDQIIAHARTVEGLAAILWPGDLYHQKSTVDDRNSLVECVRAFAALAPVLIAYGNHDSLGDLDILAKLETRWPVYVIDRPRVARFETATGVDAAAFVLPYPHKGGLVAAGVEHEQLGQDARGLLEPVFIAAAHELQGEAAAGALTLAIGHVNVGGARSSVGQPQIGREIELDPGLLARLGFIYVGLNHIHRHQEIAGAVYAGSVCRMDFGEQEIKGFIEAECVDGAWDWRFVPLDVPRQLHVEGALTRTGFTVRTVNDEPVSTGPDVPGLVLLGIDDWKDADVRCRYAFKKSEISALDVAKIHAEFAGCRSLKLDGVPELEREIRAPEVIAAPTLTAKAEACCRTMGLAVTDGLQAKLAALQTADADTLMRGVALAAEQATQPQRELTEVA